MRRQLRDILTRVKDSISIQDNFKYKRATIRTNNKGILLRDIKLGKDIGTKKQFLIKTNQFLLSKIDARNGALGIVPAELDNAVITGNFWTFDYNPQILDINWFSLFTSSTSFINICSRASSGTTNRKYLDENKFLDIYLELPTIDSQRKTATRVLRAFDSLKSLELADDKILDKYRSILRKSFLEITAHSPKLRMTEIAPIVRRKVEIVKDENYPELGIRSFGKGTFHKPELTGREVGTKKLYEIHKDDVLFSNVFAWEGAIAVVKPEDHLRYGSHRFISCVCKEGIIDPEFLCFYFLTEEGLNDVRRASPGSAGRNKTLGLSKLESLEVPVPKFSHQKKFVKKLKLYQQALELGESKKFQFQKVKATLLDEYFE